MNGWPPMHHRYEWYDCSQQCNCSYISFPSHHNYPGNFCTCGICWLHPLLVLRYLQLGLWKNVFPVSFPVKDWESLGLQPTEVQAWAAIHSQRPPNQSYQGTAQAGGKGCKSNQLHWLWGEQDGEVHRKGSQPDNLRNQGLCNVKPFSWSLTPLPTCNSLDSVTLPTSGPTWLKPSPFFSWNMFYKYHKQHYPLPCPQPCHWPWPCWHMLFLCE